MRVRDLATLGVVLVAACANGTSSPEDEVQDVDVSSSTPSTSGGARLPPPSSSSGGGATSDADPPSPPPSDAGGTDGATPDAADAGPPQPGQTCATATKQPVTCAASGSAQAVVLYGDAPLSGSTYQLAVGTGWVVQQLDSTCAGAAFSCGEAGWSVSGATGGLRWYFAIAKKDGTCGTTSATVNRLQ
jgi:hypothetical protein